MNEEAMMFRLWTVLEDEAPAEMAVLVVTSQDVDDGHFSFLGSWKKVTGHNIVVKIMVQK